MYQGKYSKNAATAAPGETAPAASRKRRKAGTIVFYCFYVLLIAAIVAGFLYARSYLQDWLVRFEASQPVYKCEEVFNQLFADPDWENIYTLSETEDTVYEGKAAYAAYMTQKVGQQELTYLETSAGLTGGKKYIVKLGEEKVATFTLTSESDAESGIDSWSLGKVEIFFTRLHSVTVEKLPEHTVYINGVALTDQHTIWTVETTAESYLPEGVHGYRLQRQQLTGLLTEPEVTVKDADGNVVALTKDPETGIYRIPTVTMEATDEEKQLALNAIEAYAKYMIRANGLDAVRACFDTNSEIYDVIRKYEAWTMQSYASYSFTDAEYTDFYRYSEELFSIRVTLQLNVKRTNGSVKPYDLNSTLFLQKQEDGKYLVIDMTNAETQKTIEHVRLTFMDGQTLLDSFMVRSDAAQLTMPVVDRPDGKTPTSWVLQETEENGNITLTVVFQYTADQALTLPSGVCLEPMVLYTHYEEAEK